MSKARGIKVQGMLTSLESRVNKSPPRRNCRIKYSFPSVWKAENKKEYHLNQCESINTDGYNCYVEQVLIKLDKDINEVRILKPV